MFRISRKPAKWALALALCPLAASALSISGSYFEDAELGKSAGDTKFAISVAISGDEAIVNAPAPDSATFGNATIYRWADSRWEAGTSITHIQTAHDFGAYLGCNPVAIEGDVVAIGIPSANSNQGMVEVFRRTTEGWLQETILADEKGAASDGFGCAIAISNGEILVGAPGKNGVGAGYVYSYDTIWKLEKQLSAGGAMLGSNVGFSGAINGAEIVLGAPHAASDRGVAYVFKKSGSTWVQMKLLSASDGAANDQFGASVAISNGTIVIGAPEHMSGDGAAYIFGGTALAQQQKLSLSGTSYYGAAIALDGDRLAVSRLGNDAVDLFARHGAVWFKSAVINGSAYTRFGGSVALSGPNVLIGAYAESGGRAYLLKDDVIFRDGLE
jgi:FG-GAP repeat